MRTRWPMEGLGALLVLATVFTGGHGWVMNIIKLIELDTFTPMALARAIGVVVVPLGAILGWIG